MTLDHQNRVGSKFGGGGIYGEAESNADRRERLRKLALETIDLSKDPYILRTHLGTIECKLCLTLHPNEGSYLAHTQGKKHQTNLARRAAKESKENELSMSTTNSNGVPGPDTITPKKHFVKIGRPGYKVTKVKQVIGSSDGGADGNEPATTKVGLLFHVHLPQIKDNEKPRRRLMSAFEQRREMPNAAYQYLLIAAEPYETIAFRVPSGTVNINQQDQLGDDAVGWDFWDVDAKNYSVQLLWD
ncbi:Pre-mRNA-splicing factor sap62 [Wallemia ichthyophaga EXF-994]|uniref:Pre-mRNA-splicing factor sap62 n=1 Tax=Wallemia ichthyophaga (strain EXF-994 / CBS 113033) TaxID=1299270 RepID=R9ABM4_WALI9|nr:Pre-mRNA-splicing factor sap62 [Wallemia ichthyophaga EXF-994]EOQ99566.1 Pre-mRNA-splicing factor sap62 [Wallemia ichthyophaga EXF-994]